MSKESMGVDAMPSSDPAAAIPIAQATNQRQLSSVKTVEFGMARSAFLMTVTPPDAELAKYTIQAALRCLSENIHLVIYFNGCHPDLSQQILAQLPASPYCFHRSNWQQILKRAAQYKDQIGRNTPGYDHFEYREGFYETGGELWSRELPALTDYHHVGLLDADLEVLDPSLLANMAQRLSQDLKLGFVSTDHSPTAQVYET